nr:TonB-dependent receptor [uncultured Flavobacterium sp.]
MFLGDSNYKRTNFLLNLGHSSKNNKFNFQGNIIKSDQKNNLMATDLTRSIFLAPNAPDLYDDEGNLNWENNTFENPLAKLNARYFSETSDFTSQMKMSYAISKNLKIGIQGGLSTVKAKETGTLPSTVMNPSLNLGSEYSSIKQSFVNQNNWIIEPTINFSSLRTNSKWDFLIGCTFEERIQTNFRIEASNFISNDFLLNTKSATNQRILNDTETIYRYSAFFGRINYNLLDRYILNITGRRDGSSRFGDNNRFGNFGAVGAAWLFSREKLFESNGWLNFGKLRASYGTSGSDLIGDYQYLNTYGINFQKYDNKIALDPLRLYNPDFSWETNKKVEAALELEFFSGRLATSVAWYQNRSSSQLVGIPLPGTTGFSSIQSNLAATVQNRGLELTLRTININNDTFQWTSSFNLSIPKNKLIAFPNLAESTYANQYVIGQSTSVRKVYHLLGVNKETGLFEFEDVNKDGKIDVDDRTTMINLGIKMFGGLQNQFKYKNWNVDFLWQFAKQNTYTPDYNISSLGRGVNRNRKLNDYFSDTNLDAFYQQPASESNSSANQAFNNYKLSDGVITDASFLRLKSLQLQYKCSEILKSKLDMSIYLQGYNLITITKFWGSDPESTLGHLPALRTFAIGFSLKY